jgi:hypothetical protein
MELSLFFMLQKYQRHGAMPQVYNPSYSGSKDKNDRGLNQCLAKSSRNLISTNGCA